ncbi:MAG: hypothetical protein ACFBSD_05420 [Paracoccaceae bacterium]
MARPCSGMPTVVVGVSGMKQVFATAAVLAGLAGPAAALSFNPAAESVLVLPVEPSFVEINGASSEILGGPEQGPELTFFEFTTLGIFGPSTAEVTINFTIDDNTSQSFTDLMVAWNDTPDFVTPIDMSVLTDSDGFELTQPGEELFAPINPGDPLFLVVSVTGDNSGPGATIQFLNITSSTEIPVPAALPLLATGLLGLGLIARRRARA